MASQFNQELHAKILRMQSDLDEMKNLAMRLRPASPTTLTVNGRDQNGSPILPQRATPGTTPPTTSQTPVNHTQTGHNSVSTPSSSQNAPSIQPTPNTQPTPRSQPTL